MKTIEIYDYDTNKPKFTIQTRKTKNIQDDVIKFLKDKKYSLILQGKVIPNIETNLYWLAYNKATKESIKLWYREKENIKEKSYKYEEFKGIQEFLIDSNLYTDNSDEAITRFYYSGDDLKYIKTIVGDKEELLEINIEYNVDDSLFEIPEGYSDGDNL